MSEIAQTNRLRTAGSVNEIEDVLLDSPIGVHRASLLPSCEHLVGTEYCSSYRLGTVGHAIKDLSFLQPSGVGHHELEHESVHLRLRQGVGALMLDRVLGREHQEQLGKRKGLAADGDLLLLHRLEERALHLGRSPIDLVGKENVGEDGSLLNREVPAPLIVDHGADQIGGKQVGRELNTMESTGDGRRHCSYRERLREAWNPFQQDVTVGQECHEEQFTSCWKG